MALPIGKLPIHGTKIGETKVSSESKEAIMSVVLKDKWLQVFPKSKFD